MAEQIQLRRDVASSWTLANPILAQGEIGIELDAFDKFKIGDGILDWNALPYFSQAEPIFLSWLENPVLYFPVVFENPLIATGDILLTGDIHATHFIGDGSGLTNLPAPVLPITFPDDLVATGNVYLTGNIHATHFYGAFDELEPAFNAWIANPVVYEPVIVESVIEGDIYQQGNYHATRFIGLTDFSDWIKNPIIFNDITIDGIIDGATLINPKIKIADGTQALNYLFTSDAFGNGSWKVSSFDAWLANPVLYEPIELPDPLVLNGTLYLHGDMHLFSTYYGDGSGLTGSPRLDNLTVLGLSTFYGNLLSDGLLTADLYQCTGLISQWTNDSGYTAIPTGYTIVVYPTIGIPLSNYYLLGSGNFTSVGGNNLGIGTNALEFNDQGFSNYAIGSGALGASDNGHNNFAIGTAALGGITGYGTDNNFAFGNYAGFFYTGSNVLTSISNSVFFGNSTMAKSNGNTNETVIGNSVIGNGSNTVTIGNGSVTDNYFNGNIHAVHFYGTVDFTESDPLSLHLDQTVQQTIINGNGPIFQSGLTSNNGFYVNGNPIVFGAPTNGTMQMSCPVNNTNSANILIANRTHDASHTYSIPNAGADADFVLSKGTNFPTSSAGLSTGDIWVDTTGGLNILKVK